MGVPNSPREEFSLLKFGLGHPDPDRFIQSQWSGHSWLYPLWRLFWFLWHAGWISASGAHTHLHLARHPGEGGKWFLYLSNITLLLTALTCAADLSAVLFVVFVKGGTLTETTHKKASVPIEPVASTSSPPEPREQILFRGEFIVIEGFKTPTTTWYIKVVWLLYNVISSINIIITVLYWTLEYPDSGDVASIEVHSINTVFIILNLLVTAMPVQMLHFIYPMAYAALYFLFNCIYLVSGGTDLAGRGVIYTALDWRTCHPTAVVVILGILLVVPMGHFIVFAIYTFRMFLHSKIYSANYSVDMELVLHSQTNDTAVNEKSTTVSSV